MNLRDTFNKLDGKVKWRHEIRALIRFAKTEDDVEVEERLRKLLRDNPGGKRFKISIKPKLPLQKEAIKKLVSNSPSIKSTNHLINESGQKVSKNSRVSKKVQQVKKKEPLLNLKSPALSDLGFTTVSEKPKELDNLFTLDGELGKFLGTLQRYKLMIAISGETHSSKSDLSMQLANAFWKKGMRPGLFDLEQGGIQSKDTRACMDRNLKPAFIPHMLVSGDANDGLKSIKKAAKELDVIIIDSWQKIERLADELDSLRIEYPDTIFIVIFQRTTDGSMKGGSATVFDPPVIIKTFRPDPMTHEHNYAILEKNRGNARDTKYLIAKKKAIPINKELKVNNEKNNSSI